MSVRTVHAELRDPVTTSKTGAGTPAAGLARSRGDLADERRHLQRAHILSQPMALPHVRTHVAMMSCGVRRGDLREVAGQLMRLLLAAPGSLTGRSPVGNTGSAASR